MMIKLGAKICKQQGMLFSALLLLSLPGYADSADPLKSVMWDFVRQKELQSDNIVFDQRVQVFAPKSVEDGMNVPVSVRVDGIDDIEQIVVLADHNPIQRVLNFYPHKADPYIAFRMKVQEATPIRAAVKTKDQQWHVGGVWLNAPGGGCTTASVSQASRLWEDNLNLIGAKVWNTETGGSRLRMRIIHPMDTGLVSSIPAFYIENMQLRNKQGEELARLESFEPVAENPVYTFSVPPENADAGGYELAGRDNDGNEFLAQVQVSGSQLTSANPAQSTQ